MELTELVALLGEGPRFVLMHNIVPLLHNGLFYVGIYSMSHMFWY